MPRRYRVTTYDGLGQRRGQGETHLGAIVIGCPWSVFQLNLFCQRLQPPGGRTRHSSPPICELRVELLSDDLATWRVIRLSSGIVLPRLHRVLLTTLGWFKAADWWFEAAQVVYGEPNESDERHDAGAVRLRHILPDTGTEALYALEVDRKEWRHRLTIDRLLTPNRAMRDAVCLSGSGTVPTPNARASGFDVRVVNAELRPTRG
ncbi:MAG TPA: hypothetical protein VJ717_16955 [Gemmatimonadaceae bacterium]|nr:hypothetical protein [Gemmatimonadaceae bacterium]